MFCAPWTSEFGFRLLIYFLNYDLWAYLESLSKADGWWYFWHTQLVFTLTYKRLDFSPYKEKLVETCENTSWVFQVSWVKWEIARLLNWQQVWLFLPNDFCFLKQLKTIRPLKIQFLLKNSTSLVFTYDSLIIYTHYFLQAFLHNQINKIQKEIVELNVKWFLHDILMTCILPRVNTTSSLIILERKLYLN